jgi:Flp pilus assembly protein TadD
MDFYTGHYGFNVLKPRNIQHYMERIMLAIQNRNLVIILIDRMKKTTFLVSILLLLPIVNYAQQREVTNAFLSMLDNDFDDAKDEIDRASVHEKTKDDPYTWFIKGKVYHSLFTSKPAKFSKIRIGSEIIAFESFSKAMILSQSTKKKEYYESSEKDLKVLHNDVFRKALEEISLADSLTRQKRQMEGDSLYNLSYEHFLLSFKISPQDTGAAQNAFICAIRLKDYNKAVYITGQLEGKVKPDPEVYATIAGLANTSQTNSTASIDWIRKGIIEFPKNINLRLLELNWYSENGKLNEAKSKLEETIQLDSSNAVLFSILGNIYDQEAADEKRLKGDRDASKTKAIKSYRKALKLDSTNFEANYNIGVYYYNKGVDLKNKYENLDLNDFQKKGKAMEANFKKEFGNGLPYFEACYKKNPNDPSTRKSLKSTYMRLGRSVDAEKIPD